MTPEEKRELLLDAAKAAGLDAYSQGGQVWLKSDNKPQDKSWNTLDDDGQCARLEAACGIDVRWFLTGVKCAGIDDACFEYYKDHNNDKNAARRYASVSVAAAIGREMK